MWKRFSLEMGHNAKRLYRVFVTAHTEVVTNRRQQHPCRVPMPCRARMAAMPCVARPPTIKSSRRALTIPPVSTIPMSWRVAVVWTTMPRGVRPKKKLLPHQRETRPWVRRQMVMATLRRFQPLRRQWRLPHHHCKVVPPRHNNHKLRCNPLVLV